MTNISFKAVQYNSIFGWWLHVRCDDPLLSVWLYFKPYFDVKLTSSSAEERKDLQIMLT
jgi:hypothetical protein